MVWVDISPFPPGGISRFQPFKVDLLPVESEKAQWMLDVPWTLRFLNIAGEIGWYNPREDIRRLGVMVMSNDYGDRS